MTQYKDLIAKRKEELKQEKLDNQVTSIDCRYENGKWTQMTISYGSGKQVTEYNDKREKDKIEWH